MLSKIFEKVEAILITSDSNRFYFTKIKTSFGVVLITAAKKYFFTDFRYEIAARKKLNDFEVVVTNSESIYKDLIRILNYNDIKTIGYEDNYWSVAKFKVLKKELKAFELKPLGNEIELLRIVKTPEEIANIKNAQAITESVLTKVISGIKAGVTEKEISAELTYKFITAGADGCAFENIVAFGDNTADCHHVVSDRKLEKNDIILIDIGAKYKGYCSDMTRTFYLGEPSKKMQEVYNLVLEAQNFTLKYLAAGMTGREADSIAREFFRANGYDREFGHSLGHGVGIDIHELPNLRYGNDEPLPENSVVTVEPGIYIEGLGGVRIEDMVVLKKGGIENLTSYPKSFII